MPVTPPGLRWHEEVGIGIVGAGGCGLVAAHAAARDGVTVAVWDKATVAGATTALSAGMLPGAGSRIQRAAGIVDGPEALARDILARNGGRSDPALTRRLCESSAGLVEWLVDTCGIPLELVPHLGDPGHSQPRLHAPPSRTGRALIDPLVRSPGRHGIMLRLGTPVVQLWMDEADAIVGLQVKRPRKTPINVRCAKVILASDGFAANRELLAQYCPAAGGLVHAGATTSTGDALAWAEDVRAATRDLGAYSAHPTVAVGSNLLVPWALLANGAILINQRGERFVDETRGAAELVTAVLSQPGRMAYEILDARILNLVTAHDPHFAAEVVPRALRRAAELTELAKQFQIDPATCARTVDAYNASLAACNAASEPPDVASASNSGSVGRRSAGEPLTSPFYCIRVCPALLETQGGLAIDTNARVLRVDGTVIPNLYGGGGAAVGLSGPGDDGDLLGNGLLCALGWGKIAGEHAVREMLAAPAEAAPTAPPTTADEPAN